MLLSAGFNMFVRPGFVAQWRPDRVRERVQFALSTTIGQYVAVGISNDNKMVGDIAKLNKPPLLLSA